MISGNKFFSFFHSNQTATSTGISLVDSFAFGPEVHVLIYALILCPYFHTNHTSLKLLTTP
jgi:hypothetical protein